MARLRAKLSVTSGLVQTGSYIVGGFVIPTRKSVRAVSNNYFKSHKLTPLCMFTKKQTKS